MPRQPRSVFGGCIPYSPAFVSSVSLLVFFLPRAPNGSTLRARCALPRGQIVSSTPPRHRTRCHLSSTQACRTLSTATTGPCTLSSGSSSPTDYKCFFGVASPRSVQTCSTCHAVFRLFRLCALCFADVAETVEWFKYLVTIVEHSSSII